MQIKTFVLTHLFRTSDNDTQVEVKIVAPTITKAKKKFAEEKKKILDEYEEKFPDNYEIGGDFPTLWNVTCKDEEIWDELMITEKEVDEDGD